MGAHQSTRKLTINNDDPANVIKVSDSVVERLKGQTGHKVSSPSVGIEPRIIPVPPIANVVPVGPGISHPPMYPHYMYEPSQTSIQVRQEKEELLRRNDAYWQNRLRQVEQSYEKMNKTMEHEYNDAVSEVKGQWFEATLKEHNPVCQEGKRAVMQCYQQHPAEPMRCASIVEAFAACVDKQRAALMANRG